MFERVDVGKQSLNRYRSSAGGDAIDQLRELAEPLRGCRVLHVNATPYGGGVAEILRSEIPLLRDLGIDADWQIIRGDETFFRVTKTIHNGLQGSAVGLSADDEEHYLAQSERNARSLDEDYDIVVVHDPQPLALLELHGANHSRWIWRCHVDTSEPNASVWQFLRPFVVRYDAAVFTLGGFVPPDFPLTRTEIIPPAIDPESPKNVPLSARLASRVVEWIGVDTRRPLIAQISRFDEWKDPLGVLTAYRLVREQVPDLQLALVGSMALDDPEGWRVYRKIQREVDGDPGIHVFTNLTGVGNVEVNAFQRLADVVVQKSLREGFGLVVSEALWKGTPVVAGRAGGIPLQLDDGQSGYLVDSVEECADRVRGLLARPDLRHEFGVRGHARVRERFLLPRLIADELRLYASVLELGTVDDSGDAVGACGEQRDPVCGMSIVDGSGRHLSFSGSDFYFCGASCEQQFAADLERFSRAT
ncbi:MAG TPA: glycosyltransferase [Acidimicrobiia bacterium]|nr:glycosyltransferase [Acidimicrobiia bacterium]